ncbi:nucleoside/nucleotide kinase family protein, partial [Rhizobium ruizarguesonis]
MNASIDEIAGAVLDRAGHSKRFLVAIAG